MLNMHALLAFAKFTFLAFIRKIDFCGNTRLSSPKDYWVPPEYERRWLINCSFMMATFTPRRSLLPGLQASQLICKMLRIRTKYTLGKRRLALTIPVTLKFYTVSWKVNSMQLHCYSQAETHRRQSVCETVLLYMGSWPSAVVIYSHLELGTRAAGNLFQCPVPVVHTRDIIRQTCFDY